MKSVLTYSAPSSLSTDEDKMKHATQMQVYVRHWKPSEFVVEDTSEIIIDENTPEHLREKLSEFSGIPANRIQFAKVS